MNTEVVEQNKDTPNTAEEVSATSSLLNNWQLKWKTKEWYGLIFFNCSMVILLVIERIISAKEVDVDGKYKVILVGAIFPILLSFFLYYMYKTIKNHKEHVAIIKPSRIKYFRIGFSSSFTSSMLSLVGIITSIHIKGIVTNIVVFTFVGVCCILGLLSSIFTSMYGFCASFDVFYHKNKEEIIKEYLKIQKMREEESKEGVETGEDENDSVKIVEEHPDELE